MCGKDHWQNARRFVSVLFCEFGFRGEWFGIAFGSYTHQTTGYHHIGPVSIVTSLTRTQKKNESTSWYGKSQKKTMNEYDILDCHLMSLLWNGGYRSFGRLTFKEKEGHRKKNSRTPLFFRKYTEPIKLCKHMPSVNHGVISNTKSMHLSVIPK